MIRAVILSATIAALFAMWRDRPAPVKSVQVDYCIITERRAIQLPTGEYLFGWLPGYGPCALQDIYREI